MRAHPSGFASIDDASEAVANYLPHRTEKKSPERLRQLLVRGDDGRLRWHWDPRLLDRVAADGERHQAALLDAARRIDVPTLLISGEKSDIVSDATIAEFLQLVPHARTRARAARDAYGGRRRERCVFVGRAEFSGEVRPLVIPAKAGIQ